MAEPDIWSAFRQGAPLDQPAAWRAACLEVLRLSGLFMPETYLPQLAAPPNDPLDHYHTLGWRAGLKPNPYFDPAWYYASYPDVAASNGDPLLHYVSYGEAEDRQPIAWFDPAWYRAQHAVPAGMHCLRHFLLHRRAGASPIAQFDSAWYLATYPDVARAGMDPMEHYLVQGYREGRNPSPEFDTRFYRLRYLRGLPGENPLLHFLAHRAEPGVFASQPATETTIAQEVRRFSAPGPAHEPVRALPPNTPRRALVLAFYLPQFHAIPENDRWWGAGFTEWANTARALPRFAGHYQPRIPADLGPYSLADPAVLPRQIALARGAGLGGFVFYFYWFDGQRLLDAPIERMLADPALDFGFCLMWANENWTRRWDGSDDEILIAQTYAQSDEPALIACFARHFADPRYIRLAGRPVLMVYRPDLIPDPPATLARWRKLFRAIHAEDPLLIMAQSFGAEDPVPLGFDAAVEFPPHKLVRALPLINHGLDLLDHQFDAQAYSYPDLVQAARAQQLPPYHLIRCAIPGWDNDARRQGHGMVIHAATPDAYRSWLDYLVTQAASAPVFGASLVCINAWNEWAEGAYLEPDRHFGAAFLNATAAAIAGAAAPTDLLLIGHDAFPAGAQLLLLHLARRLVTAHGVRLTVILCAGGKLEADYRATAPTRVLADPVELPALLACLRAQGLRHALVNSAASAWCCPALQAAGIAMTLLVHEMPALLITRALVPPLQAAAAAAQTIVFAASAVRDPVMALLGVDPARTAILPQGVYNALSRSSAPSLREEWKIPVRATLAVAVGYADTRKGFDLFLRVAALLAADARIHLAWIGDIDPALRADFAADIAAAERTGRFRLTGWRDDIAAVLTAADLFLSTAREDPYPSAALEALCLGTPVIAFQGSGGIPNLLHRGAGQVLKMEDCAAMAAVIQAATRVSQRESLLPPGHDFAGYALALLRLVQPELALISVIIPSYRQAVLLPRRLASIFGQTMSVRDIVLRDDASDDNSAEIAAACAQTQNRVLQIVRASRNSGSPFGAWRHAVRQARGDLIWIAEADDAAEPEFLARLAPAFAAPDVLLAFSDSRPIDRDGARRSEDYRASYQAAGGPGALDADRIYDGQAFARQFLAERNILFNVSGVLWRRAPLLATLDRLGDELLNWRIAGDWRLYFELLTTQPGRIAHVAQPLNQHCRDPATVTGRLPIRQHLAEIRRMHTLIRERLGRPRGLAARQRNFLAEARAHLSQ